MELSINTDFIKSVGDVRPPLKLISNAGFKYIHWCHHWCGDFLYSYQEIQNIKKLLREYDLKLFDLHASHGEEKYWCSTNETSRLAGEELLLNRIRMVHDLGGKAIVLHTNTESLSDKTKERAEQGIKTLAALEPHCRELNVKIGIENLFDNGGDSSIYDIQHYFSRFSSDYIGFCWDTGHSNIISNGVEKIRPFTQRLTILHLNDNKGNLNGDDHLPIGLGTVNWDTTARIIAQSPYKGVITQEVVLREGSTPEIFLQDVYQRGRNFASKVENLRDS